MENKRIGINETESDKFQQAVRKAKSGDKESMEEIIDIFASDIEYLSKFLMMPREEAIQILKTELISIVHEKL